MNWLGAALRELFSLFVDDVWFAVAIVIWIAFGTLGLPQLPVDPGWDAPLLFLGCAVKRSQSKMGRTPRFRNRGKSQSSLSCVLCPYLCLTRLVMSRLWLTPENHDSPRQGQCPIWVKLRPSAPLDVTSGMQR